MLNRERCVRVCLCVAHYLIFINYYFFIKHTTICSTGKHEADLSYPMKWWVEKKTLLVFVSDVRFGETEFAEFAFDIFYLRGELGLALMMDEDFMELLFRRSLIACLQIVQNIIAHLQPINLPAHSNDFCATLKFNKMCTIFREWMSASCEWKPRKFARQMIFSTDSAKNRHNFASPT